MAHNRRLWAVLRAQPTEGGLCEHAVNSSTTLWVVLLLRVNQPEGLIYELFYFYGPGRKSWAVNIGRKPTHRRWVVLVNTWPRTVRSWAVLRVKSTRRVDFTSYLLQSTTLRVVQQALHVAGWRENRPLLASISEFAVRWRVKCYTCVIMRVHTR